MTPTELPAEVRALMDANPHSAQEIRRAYEAGVEVRGVRS